MATSTLRLAGVALIALALAGCATLPAGPSLPALPGSQMSQDRFAADDARCRDAVSARLAGGTQQQFDGAYYACMYAFGHKVPVPAGDVARYRAWLDSQAPPPSTAAPLAAPGQ